MLFPEAFAKPNTNWLTEYYKFNLNKLEKDLAEKNEGYWITVAQKRALQIFHAAAKRVPAYQKFLNKRKINPSKIKTIADFSQIEPTDKLNYIQSYSLAERSLDGKLEKTKLVASSSGTSGQPNYWPRGGYQEFEAAITHELLFKNLFAVDKNSTLAIIGFPMGVYVSGMATTLPSWLVAQKYNMTIVTPGNNKAEAIKTIKTIGKNFEQILLIGHPFFIKDVLETGTTEGINWRGVKVKMLFCSEGFSEQWRKYILKEAGIKNKPAAFNTYGSSELLLMAYETPMSIALRKKMEQSQNNLIGSALVPNLFQYNPLLRFIQEKNNELLFTAISGTPLVRFNLHDSGKIIPFKQVSQQLTTFNQTNSWKLPFLSLKGRSDYTIIFYAANIYPEHIHHALNHRDLLKHITGKFTMQTSYLKNMDEFLEINIELRPKIKNQGALRKRIAKTVFEKLKTINSEFSDANKRFGLKTFPHIKLWPYNHEKYFKPGLKPRYIATA